MPLLRVALIFLLIVVDKDAKGAAVDFDQALANFTNIVSQLQENFNIQQSKMESTISSLQAEIAANKMGVEANAKLIDEEGKNITDNVDATNELSSTVHRLDKMSKMGTSCTHLAHLGNLESGYYLLDTDGVNGNQPPFDAYCKMPERQTFVGNDSAFQLDHCNETFCSEKTIEINAPMPQIILLLEASPACSQTITFHCFLAPIVFFTSEGSENYLQWRDRNGNYHNFTTMGNNCNRNWPVMTQDSIELTDPSLLPVTGIRYGPMRFEQQQAKILISKLSCSAYEDSSLKTKVSELNETLVEMKEHMNDTLEKMETADERMGKIETDLEFLSPIKCPIESSNFKLVDGICYYFERENHIYRDAQYNCRLAFGPHGHLFEPHTKEKSIEIYNLAKSQLGTSHHFWIGLDSIGRDSYQWRYASDDTPKTMTEHGYNRLDQGNYCAYLHKSNGQAYDTGCSNYAYRSICENKHVKQD